MKKGLIAFALILLMVSMPLTSFAQSTGTVVMGEKVSTSKALSFKTTTLDGKPYSSDVIKNYDLIVLNCWGEWCRPCVWELPFLQQIFENYKNVLVLGLWSGNSADKALKTAQEAGVTYPLLYPSGILNDYLRAYNGYPHTFFFDYNGNQVGDMEVGADSYEGWKHTIKERLAMLSVGHPLFITQPEDVTVCAGFIARFTAEARDEDNSYQWYGKAPDAADWTALDGYTSDTLSLIASADMDGRQYRCRLRNADSECFSRAATLHVNHIPSEPMRLNEIPATCTEDGSYDEVTYCTRCNEELSRVHKVVSALGHNPGKPVRENEVAATCTTDGSFDEVVCCTRCKAELKRTHKVEAKHHIPGQPVKENVVPATTETAGSYDEVTYCTRCKAELSRVHKTTAKLPIYVTFKAQPKSVTVKSGSKATFKVKVKEKNVTYQWYCRAPGAKKWTRIAGATKASYQVAASKANDGWQFRCGVANETEAFSNPATLTVKTQKPVIKTQPKSLNVKSGKKVKFTVKATGKNITYQWFSRADAKSAWKPVPGGNKNTLNVVASKANNGSQYYCYLKNADGDATSVTVTLTVTPEAPTIKTQPKDAKVKIGAKAKFKVKATGKNVTYQWYYRTSETGKWVLMKGQASANLTVTATADKIGWQFRCLAKNADGQVYSKPATLRQK